ncbi:sugar transferase (PEP-CTERM/EpsH1 system associated) [Orenia metallireducens]|uniref:glycosyltransferase n=1 Tax=Orenia metallireducens TaxID=1413210 RepID=UPI000D4997EB|nr:glycosyltransferase [Orenia metallireducens]PRX35674.1 sugar transferase (PEP-CTERM/EpsH1 system associated) [Orenia metallireducens]
MKKILVITSRVPYPPVGGDKLLFYNQLKFLSKNYDVDLLFINEGSEDFRSLDHLKQLCNQVVDFNYDRLKFKINTIKGLFSKTPLQIHYYYFKEVQKWIDDNYNNYDLIYNFHIRTAEYIKELDIPKVINLVDAISLNYKRAINRAKGLWNIIYRTEIDRVLNYELECINKFNKSILVSSYDKEYLVKQGANQERIKIIPVSVNDNLLNLNSQQEKERIVFLGKMNYQPNIDAVKYFTKEVFPKIKEQIKEVEFYIVGAYPTKEIESLSNINGVTVTGFVDDPYIYLQEAKVIIAPMISGAGIQNKVLEGMAVGKPVVTTSIGIQGIMAQNKENIFVTDNSGEMASLINNLLNDKNLRISIGNNARDFIKDNYTIDSIGKELKDQIEGLISNS